MTRVRGNDSGNLSAMKFEFSTKGISDFFPSTIASKLMANDPGENGSCIEETAERLELSGPLSSDRRSLRRE